MTYDVKDSGVRETYSTGMVRDTADKTRWDLAFDGPMLKRYAEHLTKGARKYEPRNWMRASTPEEMERFRESAVRHFCQWLEGDRDEDHAAAVWFNLNGYEYVRDRLGSMAQADSTTVGVEVRFEDLLPTVQTSGTIVMSEEEDE